MNGEYDKTNVIIRLTWQLVGLKCSSIAMDFKLSEQGTNFEQSNLLTIVLVLVSHW